jgi:predicted XRE-type DNA-binding protein
MAKEKHPKEKLEVVHGSGNIFRDFQDPDADIKQLKVILAAEIIKKLDRDGLSVRKAQQLTGFDASDFTRIRTAKLERFTVDRLMTIVNRLGSRVEVAVKLRPAHGRAEHARLARRSGRLAGARPATGL